MVIYGFEALKTFNNNVWHHYGFKKNPLDPTPIGISAEDRTLLVGRDQQTKQFQRLASNGHGIIVIEGNIGVGKTSFVNSMQYDLKENKFLSTYNTIEITEAMEPASMLLSSLSNMVYSLEKDVTVSTLIKPLKEGKRLVDTTLEKGLGGSISILGTGGGLQTSPTVIQPQVNPLSTIMQKFDAWTGDVVERYNYRAASITVDNFDRLSTKNMIEFMNRSRDIVLLRPNMLWVLVGPKGMFSVMEEKAPRVSEVVTGQPIVISSLSLKV